MCVPLTLSRSGCIAEIKRERERERWREREKERKRERESVCVCVCKPLILGRGSCLCA